MSVWSNWQSFTTGANEPFSDPKPHFLIYEIQKKVPNKTLAKNSFFALMSFLTDNVVQMNPDDSQNAFKMISVHGIQTISVLKSQPSGVLTAADGAFLGPWARRFLPLFGIDLEPNEWLDGDVFDDMKVKIGKLSRRAAIIVHFTLTTNAGILVMYFAPFLRQSDIHEFVNDTGVSVRPTRIMSPFVYVFTSSNMAENKRLNVHRGEYIETLSWEDGSSERAVIKQTPLSEECIFMRDTIGRMLTHSSQVRNVLNILINYDTGTGKVKSFATILHTVLISRASVDERILKIKAEITSHFVQ